MKVLVIGAGSMGQRHIGNAIHLGHEVTVFDPPAAKADRIGPDVRIAPNIVDGVDWAQAVVIASPARLHAEHLSAVGVKPTLVEKPAVLDGATLPAIEAPVTVGYNMRYLQPVQRLKMALATMGTPYFATIHIFCDMSTWPGSSYADTLNECSHEIDLALHLLGPARVQAAHSPDGRHWSIGLLHDSGCYTTILMSSDSQFYKRGGTITTDRDTLTWRWKANTPTGEFAWHTGSGSMQHLWNSPVERSYLTELSRFLKAAAYGQLDPLGCTLDEGLAVAGIVGVSKALVK